MKIIGGSFGASGKARFAGKYLEVLGEKQKDYQGSDVESVTVRQEKERQFGIFGALIGTLLFGYIGSLFLGVIGWVAGLLFAITGSFYHKRRYFADLEFKDGLKLTLEPNDHEAKKLVKFAET
ncbi:MAG: hypothetical protein CMG91_04740 [Marinobacter sp.]|nr:hypothetical protein [Marinobacter sp.]MBP55382.1 hypothetical protein [Marinobacter sp.]|tara:strand:+ start:1865 stop:2233 length:369 start_codon:yes stop_codon:yes gene_type:complete